MEQIPVYAFTGFLDSGKTKFIQETFEDERFNAGERTLLLVFEEGEEEYDVRTGGAAITGKLCVIGSKLDEKAIAGLFGV